MGSLLAFLASSASLAAPTSSAWPLSPRWPAVRFSLLLVCAPRSCRRRGLRRTLGGTGAIFCECVCCAARVGRAKWKPLFRMLVAGRREHQKWAAGYANTSKCSWEISLTSAVHLHKVSFHSWWTPTTTTTTTTASRRHQRRE